MRNPSLHITKEDLVTVLAQIQLRKNISPLIVANEIFEKAQPYQMTDSYKAILDLKAKTKKKVKKSQDVDSTLPKGSVEMFNRILTSKRINDNPHKKVNPILATSKDYILLKEITLQAYEFCSNFALGRESGFKAYVEIGLGCMSRYGLNRFKTYQRNIYEKFESALDVRDDDKPESTALVYEVWRAMMVEYTSFEDIPHLKNDPTKYVHIVYARKEADKLEADYIHWVRAQFEQLLFLNSIPELMQFYGDNSIKRYERFLNQDAAIEDDEDGGLIDMYKDN